MFNRANKKVSKYYSMIDFFRDRTGCLLETLKKINQDVQQNRMLNRDPRVHCSPSSYFLSLWKVQMDRFFDQILYDLFLRSNIMLINLVIQSKMANNSNISNSNFCHHEHYVCHLCPYLQTDISNFPPNQFFVVAVAILTSFSSN